MAIQLYWFLSSPRCVKRVNNAMHFSTSNYWLPYLELFDKFQSVSCQFSLPFWDFVGLEQSGTYSSRRRERIARWCIQQARLTLVCEVIRYRSVWVRQNSQKDFSGWRPAIAFLYLFLFRSLLHLTSFLSQSKNQMCFLDQRRIFPWKISNLRYWVLVRLTSL